jgi:hypothetical protein
VEHRIMVETRGLVVQVEATQQVSNIYIKKQKDMI